MFSSPSKSILHKKLFTLAAIVGLVLAIGCNQISSSDESIRENRAATVTANVAATLASSTLNPTLLSEGLAVQTAMDAWMAASDEWPEVLEEPTNDLTTTDPALVPTYLSSTELACKYTWDSQGRTKQHC